jgi:hypothetical protein
VKSVICVNPDHDDPVPVRFQESGDRVSFTVTATNLYSMLVIGQE